jgi:hypothetical protein
MREVMLVASPRVIWYVAFVRSRRSGPPASEMSHAPD